MPWEILKFQIRLGISEYSTSGHMILTQSKSTQLENHLSIIQVCRFCVQYIFKHGGKLYGTHHNEAT